MLGEDLNKLKKVPSSSITTYKVINSALPRGYVIHLPMMVVIVRINFLSDLLFTVEKSDIFRRWKVISIFIAIIHDLKRVSLENSLIMSNSWLRFL